MRNMGGQRQHLTQFAGPLKMPMQRNSLEKMLFSCKITNSVLTYLDRRGGDLEFLFDSQETPVELLRDPAGWFDADKMEAFLQLAENKFEQFSEEGALLTSVGHKAAELRAWGVLDSVLRMMQKPQDIFLQPKRLISYFVAPEPPLLLVSKNQESVEWEIPISTEQYPKVTEYLRAALESLPVYVGRSLCQVEWQGSRLKISWNEEQELLVAEEPRHLKPELVQTIVDELEQAQRDLEEKTKELGLVKQKLADFEKQISELSQTPKQPQACLNLDIKAEPVMTPVLQPQEAIEAFLYLPQETRTKLQRALNQVHRFNDYMVRSQQLVTLLIGQERMNPQVREAMKRTDWEFVRSEYPHLAKEIVNLIQDVQKKIVETTAPPLNPRSDNDQSNFRDHRPGDFRLEGPAHS